MQHDFKAGLVYFNVLVDAHKTYLADLVDQALSLKIIDLYSCMSLIYGSVSLINLIVWFAAYTRWGILDSSKDEDRLPSTWDRLFLQLREEGYSAIEACMGPFNPFAGQANELKALLDRHGLFLVAQVSTPLSLTGRFHYHRPATNQPISDTH